MTVWNTVLSEELEQYLIQNSEYDNSDLNYIYNSANRFDEPYMQISKLQASILQGIVLSHDIKTVFEVGTFVGYSSSIIAKVLPEEGIVLTCECNKEYAKVAKDNIKNLSYEDRIEIVNEDAKSTLLNPSFSHKPIDLFFLDGDKENYDFYLKWCISNLEKGAFLIIDNILFKGSVLKDDNRIGNVIARMVSNVKKTNVFNFYFIPVGDGMLVSTKKV